MKGTDIKLPSYPRIEVFTRNINICILTYIQIQERGLFKATKNWCYRVGAKTQLSNIKLGKGRKYSIIMLVASYHLMLYKDTGVTVEMKSNLTRRKKSYLDKMNTMWLLWQVWFITYEKMRSVKNVRTSAKVTSKHAHTLPVVPLLCQLCCLENTSKSVPLI